MQRLPTHAWNHFASTCIVHKQCIPPPTMHRLLCTILKYISAERSRVWRDCFLVKVDNKLQLLHCSQCCLLHNCGDMDSSLYTAITTLQSKTALEK